MSGILPSKEFNGTFIHDYLLAIIWAILIISLSFLPGKSIPSFNWSSIVGIDKLAHMFMYTVFCAFVFYGKSKKSKHIKTSEIAVIMFFIASFGILLELGQHFLFWGRSFEFLDIIANIIGSFVGFFLFRVYLKF